MTTEEYKVIEVKRIWRDDAIIYPDGRREGAWVECKVYEPEPVPETREGYIQCTSNNLPLSTRAGIESFADLWERLIEMSTEEDNPTPDDEGEPEHD